jgi:hypothetical protein
MTCGEQEIVAAVGDEFATKWLKRFGLPSAWREPARKHLEQLCFTVLRDRKPERLDLAEAYGWCCFAFWQCESAFPSFPESSLPFCSSNCKKVRRDALLTVGKPSYVFSASHALPRRGCRTQPWISTWFQPWEPTPKQRALKGRQIERTNHTNTRCRCNMSHFLAPLAPSGRTV